MTRINIAAFREVEPGKFLASDGVTLGQWRAAYRQLLDDRAKRHPRAKRAPTGIVAEIGRVIRLAEA